MRRPRSPQRGEWRGQRESLLVCWPLRRRKNAQKEEEEEEEGQGRGYISIMMTSWHATTQQQQQLPKKDPWRAKTDPPLLSLRASTETVWAVFVTVVLCLCAHASTAQGTPHHQTPPPGRHHDRRTVRAVLPWSCPKGRARPFAGHIYLRNAMLTRCPLACVVMAQGVRLLRARSRSTCWPIPTAPAACLT